MKQFIDLVNHYAPTLTLVGALCAFVWVAGRWSAQVDEVRRDLQEIGRDVEAVQADVQSVRETLPHMVSCMMDLERSLLTALIVGGTARTDPGQFFTAPSWRVANRLACEQPRRRATECRVGGWRNGRFESHRPHYFISCISADASSHIASNISCACSCAVAAAARAKIALT